jgi:hypothetical protein
MKGVILDVRKLVFGASEGRDIHVLGRRAKILVFFAGEDIDGDQMDFAMAVLLGRFYRDDLAGTSSEDDVTRADVSIQESTFRPDPVSERSSGAAMKSSNVLVFAQGRHCIEEAPAGSCSS